MTTHELSVTHQLTATETDGSSASLLEAAMQAVEQTMHDVVDSDVTTLRDASRHILAAGGKRVRPRLVLLSYGVTGGQEMGKAVPPAAALELVHTASVVHDDINDHGVVRRGRPSVNAIWGRTFALLTGDYLFTKVYELVAPYKDLNILFARAATSLVEGETLQASAVKEKNFSRERYMDIIALKTAALFETGAELGARLSGAPQWQVDALARYGYNIGLAFQIIDDILDIIGDEEQLGKTAGLDIQQGKGYTAVDDDNSNAVESVKRKLMAGDRLEKARQQAGQLKEIAISELEVFPDSDYKTELINLAHSVVERTS
jgi:geranylgeranyl pyrophosphate synthase